LLAIRFIHSILFVNSLLPEYSVDDTIEKNEMGVACGAYGGGERAVQGSGVET